jgi:transcriptional regulator with XRE-family HTH domain
MRALERPMADANSDRRRRRALRKSASSRAPRVTMKTLNRSSDWREEGNLSSEGPWYAGRPMTPDDTARAARERFVKWMEWFVKTYPVDSGGSFEQLAGKLGVSNAAVSKWRKASSTTYPGLKNIIRMHALIAKSWEGFKVEDLLFRNPPSGQKR